MAASLPERRNARCLKLKYLEAVALMSKGKTWLKRADVMIGVAELIPEIQMEATFSNGTKLVTVHQPIAWTTA